MKLTGAQIFVECLKELEVDTIFGYPGGAVLNIYDELYNNQKEINHILTAHEQAAAHAADGYARATGRTGVCISTSGPGATNLVTGIATAYMDSVPMVAFTGQVGTSLLGKDSFQEVDITGVTTPITKHNYIVKDVKNLADTIREAFAIAQDGRPGPVLVDICKDVTANKCEYKPCKNSTDFYLDQHKGIQHPVVSDDEIGKLAKLINSAKKPFIMAGGGVAISKSHELLTALSKKANIPVATTLMGIGTFASEEPLYTGLIGMHGNKTSNLAANKCDLFIAIGARFSDRVVSDISRFASQAKIVHIDVDPAEINKNINTFYSLVGDFNDILGRLLVKVEDSKDYEWADQIKLWKIKFPLAYVKDGNLKPQEIIRKFSDITNGEALVVTEVGQNQLWAAQWYRYKFPRQYISSGGLGTMGYGFGAAIGAQVGCMDKIVLDFAGDGSFKMNINELATAVKYKLPIKIIVLNNTVLGMVRQWQDMFYDKRFSHTTLESDLDFAKIAQAFGAEGIRIDKEEDIDAAIKKAMAITDGPVVLDFRIDKDEKVYPIVPPGAPIDKLITS